MSKLTYVLNSSYRVSVLKSIGLGFKMPTEIAKDTGIVVYHISNVLRELSTIGLVVCLNPNYRKGRLYRLTDQGLRVLRWLR